MNFISKLDGLKVGFASLKWALRSVWIETTVYKRDVILKAKRIKTYFEHLINDCDKKKLLCVFVSEIQLLRGWNVGTKLLWVS